MKSISKAISGLSIALGYVFKAIVVCASWVCFICGSWLSGALGVAAFIGGAWGLATVLFILGIALSGAEYVVADQTGVITATPVWLIVSIVVLAVLLASGAAVFLSIAVGVKTASDEEEIDEDELSSEENFY